MISSDRRPETARAIDHAVLPVTDLNVARQRYGRLGFTVAPDGIHPFGTKNANILFSDGTFLEPIAVADSRAYDAAERTGNTFVRNDRAYRNMSYGDGFSHLVVATADAAADDDRFSQAGISGGGMVEFSRDFETPGGERQRAAFRLAFAAPRFESDARFFSCEYVTVPSVDRSALIDHGKRNDGNRRCHPEFDPARANTGFFPRVAAE